MIIIAVYINVENMPRAKADEVLQEACRDLCRDNPDGVIYHVLGSNVTKMELIYPPALNADVLASAMKKLQEIK